MVVVCRKMFEQLLMLDIAPKRVQKLTPLVLRHVSLEVEQPTSKLVIRNQTQVSSFDSCGTHVE